MTVRYHVWVFKCFVLVYISYMPNNQLFIALTLFASVGSWTKYQGRHSFAIDQWKRLEEQNQIPNIYFI